MSSASDRRAPTQVEPQPDRDVPLAPASTTNCVVIGASLS